MNTARPLPFAFVLLVFVVSVGLPAAPADELLEDTSAIESLTPDQARKLAADFPGALVEITIMGRSKATFSEALPLNGLKALDATIARPLAGFRGPMLVLNGLTSLDPATAEALAEYKGCLHFQSLTTLDAAEALAEYRGLIGLGKDVIEKLVADHPLSPQTALVYASLSNGVLPFLTAFDSPDSVEIAKALATRKGRLALPNLRKISPKTLTALIAKMDVEIPPLATLELIAEPDGSVTEDFIIPEGFEAR